MVTLTDLGHGGSKPYSVVVYVVLNKVNGRGSMDVVQSESCVQGPNNGDNCDGD